MLAVSGMILSNYAVVWFALLVSGKILSIFPAPSAYEALFTVFCCAISIWSFLHCPHRRWIAKGLTLLFLIGTLGIGVMTVGAFVIHILGYGRT